MSIYTAADTSELTSGQSPKAPDSLAVLQKLLRDAKRTLDILPGSGITADTAAPLLDALLPYGLREIHLSAGAWVPGEAAFRREGMGMGIGGDGEWGVWRASEDVVRAVRQIADERWKTRQEKKASDREAAKAKASDMQ